ncbi:hypothetical protein [Acinetobacter venetianus]|uniref:hypothetical protein n=1 Tax=Acinetobacter venetianus TaxID=52133 RepID=UPI003A95CB4C
MSNANKVYLDVRMASFKGTAVRLFSAYDIRNNTILVSKELPFRPSDDDSKLSPEEKEKKLAIANQTLIITDSPDAFSNYDIAFLPNDHLDMAANAYLAYHRQGVLQINEEIKGRANVENVLDAKNLEIGKGMVYQLDPQSTTNLHIAVLALCFGAKRATGGSTVLHLLDEENTAQVHDESVMPFTI